MDERKLIVASVIVSLLTTLGKLIIYFLPSAVGVCVISLVHPYTIECPCVSIWWCGNYFLSRNVLTFQEKNLSALGQHSLAVQGKEKQDMELLPSTKRFCEFKIWFSMLK